MKKFKKYGSLVALSAGIIFLGANSTHAETPYNSVQGQFIKEKSAVNQKSLVGNIEKSKVASVVRSAILPQMGFKTEALTGNKYYESEPNNDFSTANLLNQGDIVIGTFSQGDLDFYGINVPQTNGGLLTISAIMSQTSLSDVGFVLFDTFGNPIYPVQDLQDNHQYTAAYDVPAGTYYIVALNPTTNVTTDTYGLAWDMALPDTTAPSAPTVNKVSETDHIVTGTAEPNSTVDVVKGGILLGETTADANGHFSVSIPPERGGTVISVFATDAAGNVGAPTTVTVTATPLNGWVVKADQHYYYVNDVIQKGWLTVGGKKYYLDPSTGVMKTGWVLNGGKWYYFNKTTGIMTTGWILDGKWYYLNTDGSMKTGWLYYNRNWYFLNKDGSMATGWVYTGGKWYYMYSSGIMAHDTKIGSYRIDHNGVWIH